MSELRLEVGEHDGEPFYISAEKLLTGRTAVIGMSGSGKSHLMGVLCEELCKAGLSFVVIDPEGEYHTLKEKYEVVWSCNRADADVRLSLDGCSSLADTAVSHGARLILDTSESSNEIDIVTQFLDNFYEAEDRARMPILLLVEEADRFVPQSGGESVRWLHEISRRGRKRGIGLVVATQRPAMVDKNVISQCGGQLIGRLRTENDLKAVSLFFHSSSMLKALPDLKQGQFNVMGDLSPKPCTILARQRHTSHAGGTPGIVRREEFIVSNFVSNMGSGAKEQTTEPYVEDASQSAKQDSFTESTHFSQSTAVAQNISSGDSLLGIQPKVSMEDALKIAHGSLGKAMLIGKSIESIEDCTLAYWPLMVVNLEVAKRGLFGLNIDSIQAIWDPVSSAWIRLDERNDIRENFIFDQRLLSCSWKELRVLRELARQDMTTSDMVPKTGLSVEESRRAVGSLKKSSLVVEGGKIGKSPLYRPLLKFNPPRFRELRTNVPSFQDIKKPIEVHVPDCSSGERFLSQIVRGSYEDTQITGSTKFHMPFYIIKIRNKKTGVQRTLRINGVTGGVDR